MSTNSFYLNIKVNFEKRNLMEYLFLSSFYLKNVILLQTNEIKSPKIIVKDMVSAKLRN